MSEAVPDRFRISTEQDAFVIQFHLPSEIEALEFDLLNQQLADAISAHIGGRWIVDLTTVAYAGSALLGMLINIRTRVRKSRGTMVLCRMDPLLERVLRAGSMDKLFLIVDTREAAFDAL